VTRVVLDSNVIASGLTATSGTVALIARRWLSDEFMLITSEHIIAEVTIAWNKPYWQARVPPGVTTQLLEVLTRRAEIVLITRTVSRIAAHPHDDLVIATAISGNASLIVTGDREFLRVRQYEGVEIISPQEFLTRLDETDAS